MDTISIIIPCYNMEQKIGKCISSIKKQSYENFEAIFVDDGSTDKTKNIIEEQIKNDERMKYFHKENGGVSSSRNYGIEKATGAYICFIDSDDYVEKDYLKELYDNLISNNSDIAICNFSRVYEDKIVENKIKKDFYHLIRFPAAWNKLYKTSLFKDNHIEFPNKRVGEDLSVFGRLLMITDKISVVEKSLYNYIQSPTSSTHTYDDSQYDTFEMTESIENFAKERNLFDEFHSKLEFINIYHIFVATAYRLSFRPDFSADTIRRLDEYVSGKYPNWYKNEGIGKYPLFYRIYFNALHKKQYKLISILLKTFNTKMEES